MQRLRALALGSLVLLAACQEERGPLAPQDPTGEGQFARTGQQFDAPDRTALARAVPGFGGIFLDGEGVTTVVLTNPAAQRAAAERALEAFMRGRGQAASQLRTHRGDYGYDELDGWFRSLWPEALGVSGAVFADLNETRNRLLIGVADDAAEPQLRAIAARLGIPTAAVVVERTQPIVELATLQERASAIVGGIQIHFGQYLCTLGFNALSGSQESFITNSHCTNTQGGVDGTVYYQPLSTIDNTVIGTEVADPTYFRGGECPIFYRCRYSDAARVRQEPGRTFTRGRIAKTTGPNNGSLGISGEFTITGTFSQPGAGVGCAVEGTTVNKVGRTTGWTAGAITASCIHVGVSGSNKAELYQNMVAAGVGGGDSGSPTFAISGGDNVTLHGILWGGSADGSTFVYSPFANIQQELGTLTVTGSVAPPPPPSPPTAPSNLNASAPSSSTIDLAWADNSSDETRFELERSTDGNSFSLRAMPGAATTTYTDGGLTAGTPYWYRVRACRDTLCSAYSNTASATTASPGGGTMHVGDLDGSVNVKGKSGKWEAFVTVVVHADTDAPLANATVTLTWSGTGSPNNGQVTGVTDASGAVTLGTGNITSGSSVAFTVQSLTHASRTYDATKNHDPESDSNGTTIVVSN